MTCCCCRCQSVFMECISHWLLDSGQIVLDWVFFLFWILISAHLVSGRLSSENRVAEILWRVKPIRPCLNRLVRCLKSALQQLVDMFFALIRYKRYITFCAAKIVFLTRSGDTQRNDIAISKNTRFVTGGPFLWFKGLKWRSLYWLFFFFLHLTALLPTWCSHWSSYRVAQSWNMLTETAAQWHCLIQHLHSQYPLGINACPCFVQRLFLSPRLCHRHSLPVASDSSLPTVASLEVWAQSMLKCLRPLYLFIGKVAGSQFIHAFFKPKQSLILTLCPPFDARITVSSLVFKTL